MEAHAEAVRNLELAVRNVRVVARGAMRAISLGDRVPPELATALHDLAEAVDGIGPVLAAGEAEAARPAEAARRAAANANAAMEETGNMSALHLIGQVRSTAVDLQRTLGVDRATAVEGVRIGEGAGG